VALLDSAFQVCAEAVGFLGGEGLAHGLGQCGHEWVGGDVKHGGPRPWLGPADVKFQFEVYFVEPSRFGVLDEVALIKVEHRVTVRRLDGFEECSHSGREVGYRSGVEAAEEIGIAVDRFGQREPTPRA
jgi:hypothetical protein